MSPDQRSTLHQSELRERVEGIRWQRVWIYKQPAVRLNRYIYWKGIFNNYCFRFPFSGKVVLETWNSGSDSWEPLVWRAVIKLGMLHFSLMYWVTSHPDLYTAIINIFNRKWKGITSDTEYLHKLAAPQGANFGLPSLQTSGLCPAAARRQLLNPSSSSWRLLEVRTCNMFLWQIIENFMEDGKQLKCGCLSSVLVVSLALSRGTSRNSGADWQPGVWVLCIHYLTQWCREEEIQFVHKNPSARSLFSFRAELRSDGTEGCFHPGCEQRSPSWPGRSAQVRCMLGSDSVSWFILMTVMVTNLVRWVRWVRAMNHSLSLVQDAGCGRVVATERKRKDEKHIRHTNRTGSASLSPHLSPFFPESIWLHARAVKLVPPPTNPSILMLVHIGLGHIKPMINDVLIGLFSTTEPRCWVDSTLAYLSHPACQRRMFPAGLIKAWYKLEGWDTFVHFCFPAEHSDTNMRGKCDGCHLEIMLMTRLIQK